MHPHLAVRARRPHSDAGQGVQLERCPLAEDIPAIVVNRGMASERKRLTIFHELGHLLLKCAPGVDKERMCNVFANEVLIPSDKFRGLIGEARHDISLVELQSVQKEYGVSQVRENLNLM